MRRLWIAMSAGVLIGAIGALVYSAERIPPSATLDPLPEPYYRVLFENEHVRVVEHRLNPGQAEPVHDHPPMVVYFLEDAEARITGPDGDTFDETLIRGQVLELPALSHAIENLGDTPVHSILVELKTTPASD